MLISVLDISLLYLVSNHTMKDAVFWLRNPLLERMGLSGSRFFLVVVAFYPELVPLIAKVSRENSVKRRSFTKSPTSSYPMSVSYTHLTLPTTCRGCRSRWSPYH